MINSDSWSNSAQSYSTNSALIAHFSHIAALKLSSYPELSAPVSFVDIAGGPGTFTFEIMKLVNHTYSSSSTFVMTDISAGMVEKASQIYAAEPILSTPNIFFQVEDGQNLSFHDKSFSIVSCMFGIMFFPQRMKGLSEMFRVLKQDGIAVISTWNENDIAALVHEFSKFLGLTKIDECTPMSTIVSVCSIPSILKQELEAVGFQDIDIMEEHAYFIKPNDEDFLTGLLGNPVVQATLEQAPIDTIQDEWKKFMCSGVGNRFLNADGLIHLHLCANIAIVRKY